MRSSRQLQRVVKVVLVLTLAQLALSTFTTACSPTSFSSSEPSAAPAMAVAANGQVTVAPAPTATPATVSPTPTLTPAAAQTRTYVVATSCGGFSTLHSLDPNAGREGSMWSCQRCSSYFDSANPNVDVGPFTGCVREIYQPAGWPTEIQGILPAAPGKDIPSGYNWTVHYSCQPVDESQCALTNGQYYARTWDVTKPMGPFDPNALPAGLSIVPQ